MRFYLDLVVGLNFTVDFLLLLGTNQLMGYPGGKGRCAAAAAFGAVYAGLCLLPGFGALGSWPGRAAMLGIMGILAFGPEIGGVKRLAVFSLLSMALGGLAAGLSAGGGAEVLLPAAGIWALCVLAGESGSARRQYVKVEIPWEGKQVSVMALCDSGNGLKDPVTGASVLVLGPEEAGVLLGLSAGELRDPGQAILKNPGKKLRLIPCTTVTGRGIMLAKRFPDVRIGEKRCSVLVAFAPEKIGRGESFQALAGGMLG